MSYVTTCPFLEEGTPVIIITKEMEHLEGKFISNIPTVDGIAGMLQVDNEEDDVIIAVDCIWAPWDETLLDGVDEAGPFFGLMNGEKFLRGDLETHVIDSVLNTELETLSP